MQKPKILEVMNGYSGNNIYIYIYMYEGNSNQKIQRQFSLYLYPQFEIKDKNVEMYGA